MSAPPVPFGDELHRKTFWPGSDAVPKSIGVMFVSNTVSGWQVEEHTDVVAYELVAPCFHDFGHDTCRTGHEEPTCGGRRRRDVLKGRIRKLFDSDRLTPQQESSVRKVAKYVVFDLKRVASDGTRIVPLIDDDNRGRRRKKCCAETNRTSHNRPSQLLSLNLPPADSMISVTTECRPRAPPQRVSARPSPECIPAAQTAYWLPATAARKHAQVAPGRRRRSRRARQDAGRKPGADRQPLEEGQSHVGRGMLNGPPAVAKNSPTAWVGRGVRDERKARDERVRGIVSDDDGCPDLLTPRSACCRMIRSIPNPPSPCCPHPHPSATWPRGP